MSLHDEDYRSWIDIQRITMSSYLLGSLAREQSSRIPPAIANRIDNLSAFLQSRLQALTPSQAGGLLPFTYSALTAVSAETWEEIGGGALAEVIAQTLPSLNKVVKRLLTKGEVPIHSATGVLAQHAINSGLTGHAFLRDWQLGFASHLRYFQGSSADFATLDAHLAALRDPIRSLDERVGAVSAIKRLLLKWDLLDTGLLTYAWPQFRNHVYQQFFAWPLLVSGSDRQDTLPAAIAVPVYVDVTFSTVKNMPAVSILPRTDTAWLRISDWRPHLERSVRAAKIQWRSKHGNFRAFRDKVRNARVIFDFRAVEHIATDMFAFRLTDSSAEAYLSQVVLGKFLGSSRSMTSAITGSIGRRRLFVDFDGQLQEAMDYEFCPPSGLEMKIRHVFESRMFERIVVPIGNTPEERSSLSAYLTSSKDIQRAEVIHSCASLQNVADVVQAQGWRQYRFVRCPDIAWRFSARPLNRLDIKERHRMQWIAERLRANSQPVIHVERDVTPAMLVDALRHINSDLRNQQLSPEPMLSVAFVRSVEGEAFDRFWQIIWEVMGAPPESWDRFAQSETEREAATELANVFNTLTPPDRLPAYRAPDVLVLLDVDHQKSAYDSTVVKEVMQTRALHIIAEALNTLKILKPTHLSEFIGPTRIVLIGGSEVDAAAGSTPELKLAAADSAALDALQVFRFGFTQHVATGVMNVIGLSGLDIRVTLDRLVQSRALRQSYGSEYFLPYRVGPPAAPASAEIALRQALLHYQAALGFAPYLGDMFNRTGLSIERALLPWNASEAAYHLRQVYALVRQVVRDGSPIADQVQVLENKSRDGARHISMDVDRDSWAKVDMLRRLDVRAAVDLAEELREISRTRAPELLSRLARCYAGLAKKDSSYTSKADATFREALTLCPNNIPVRLLILSYYITFRVEGLGDALDKPETKVFDEEMVRLLSQERGRNPCIASAVPAVWFELHGDAEMDPRKAMEWYLDGMQNVKNYYTSWIKYCGAAAFAFRLSEAQRETASATASQGINLAEILEGRETYYSRNNYRGCDVRVFAGLMVLAQYAGYTFKSDKFRRSALDHLLRASRAVRNPMEAVAQYVACLSLAPRHVIKGEHPVINGLTEAASHLPQETLRKDRRGAVIVAELDKLVRRGKLDAKFVPTVRRFADWYRPTR